MPKFNFSESECFDELSRRMSTGAVDEQSRKILFRLAAWRHCMARPEQIPRHRGVTYLLGGRGSGKTRSGTEALFRWAMESPGSNWAVVGPTTGHVRRIQFLGRSGFTSIIPPEALKGGSWDEAFKASQLELHLANGSIIQGFSGETPGRLRGPEFSGFWLDEPAELPDSMSLPSDIDTTWSNLILATRQPSKQGMRGVITGTPAPCTLLNGNHAGDKGLLSEGFDSPEIHVQRLSTRDNLANLDENFQRIVMALDGTRLGRQEIDGEILADFKDALWQPHWITVDTHTDVGEFQAISIGVDPSSGGERDETGIVVAGLDQLGRIWVLEDLSDTHSPAAWASVIWSASDRWAVKSRRDPVVCAESNYGGKKLIQTTLLAGDPTRKLQLETPWANASKAVRAQPVASLYEPTEAYPPGSQIVHAQHLPELVLELTTWNPNSKRKDQSPNRLDAMVYAVLKLMDMSGRKRLYRKTGRGGFKTGNQVATEAVRDASVGRRRDGGYIRRDAFTTTTKSSLRKALSPRTLDFSSGRFRPPPQD